MEKVLVIKRLEEAIDILENKISDSEFKYIDFVQKFDFEHSCGTVCCLAGWYPKYAPESGLKWNLDNPRHSILTTKTGSYKMNAIDDTLTKYHGLSNRCIDYIFYGTDLLSEEDDEMLLEVKFGLSSNRHDVAGNIRNLIALLNEGKYDSELLIK